MEEPKLTKFVYLPLMMEIKKKLISDCQKDFFEKEVLFHSCFFF